MVSTELYLTRTPSTGHVARIRCAFGLPSAARHLHAQSWNAGTTTAFAGTTGLAHDDNYIHRSDPPTS